ncbi:cation-translocating P-type ATPase [Reyranella aquatilis]|uniref:Cation-translocating P-type ATPase n=1 Tax=Reyranella aquatilis TaxID=2035356 RepID=A0ABS8KZR6_9HYPH|nr:cation-translocating P-type ATPase [Reyranella aquatilis]MCC8431571.1 cation-translocating P-type ATPase [Reyranella aquatilis]
MTSDFTGLTEQEAGRRLVADGPNELPSAGPRRLWQIAFEILREPMFGLLLAGGAVYVALGDLVSGAVLMAFASLSVSISIVQEIRSEKVLDALRAMTSPRALVIRDGRSRRIPGREVVRGDVVLVAEGNRIPADGVLLEARELLVDESMLTGESVAVAKRARGSEAEGEGLRPGGDNIPAVFSGSLVVRGTGVVLVLATGAATEIGRIGKSLASIDAATPRLSLETRRLVRLFAMGGLLASVAVIVTYGLLRGSWLDAALAGIAVGMAMLPEEFPLVLAVFMTMGAWRISQARVLTRRATAIETLGAATVLCTDKTGTLTRNQMTVAACVPADGSDRVQLLRWAELACVPEAFDPMDRAIAQAASVQPESRSLVRGYGLSADLLAVTQVWRLPGTARLAVAAKGAPEAIIDLCRLLPEQARAVRDMVESLGAQGIRVLGVAHGWSDEESLPNSPRGYSFQWAGLVGLADPLRPEVPVAIAECLAAGLRVVMITGDHPTTARAIAREAGLSADTVLTGQDLLGLSDTELRTRVETVGVFARILPEQKLRIVEALQARGDVVAMTGDGVNDAPSLKRADIGIAMGGRGTDVAREASSIVLLDDDFGSVVRTVRLGRRIYDNLRKAMGYIVAVHVPIAGIALLPLLTGLPLILLPVHIAFLEMIIDPACSVAFEAEHEEPDVMTRPPRAPDARLFSPSMLVASVLQGVAALLVTSLVYLLAVQRGMPEDDVRTLTFFTLVLSNLGLIVANRSFRGHPFDFLTGGNRVLLGIQVLTIAFLAATVTIPPVRRLFGFGPLHLHDAAMVALACSLLGMTLALLRWLGRRWSRTGPLQRTGRR